MIEPDSLDCTAVIRGARTDDRSICITISITSSFLYLLNVGIPEEELIFRVGIRMDPHH